MPLILPRPIGIRRALVLLAVVAILAIPVTPTRAEPNSLESLDWQYSPEAATVTLSVRESVQPQIRFLPDNTCWQIDLVGFQSQLSFPGGASVDGPIRLIQAEEISRDPLVQRVSCYVRSGTLMKCAVTDRTIQLSFRLSERRLTPKTAPSGTSARTPQPLLLPLAEKRQITINVKNSPVEPIVAELSRQAFPLLKFRDPLPTVITMNRTFSTPQAALEGLLRSHEFVVTQETEGTFVSRRDNPLLQVPGDNEIYWKALAGLTLDECLTRVLGDRRAKVQALIPQEALNRKFPEFDLVTSSRRWLELLSQSHHPAPPMENSDA